MSASIDRPRRRWLRSLGVGSALLGAGCASVPSVGPGPSTAQALALYDRSAKAHGLAGYSRLTDINVSYGGRWHDFVTRLQPVLVDAGYRQTSEERLLPALGLIGQTHTGPAGDKHVLRRRRVGTQGIAASEAGEDRIEVWKDGRPVSDTEELSASALVVDGYRLFLLGPLAYAGSDARFALGEPVWIGERRCDALIVSNRPGLGYGGEDRVVLYVDRENSLVRRIRFTLEGLQSTKAAIAEVDTEGHVDRYGVRWPTRFFERLVKPIPGLPVHRWTLTGLDVDRGYGPSDLGTAERPRFSGSASAPARPL